jgi:hypothetical protein
MRFELKTQYGDTIIAAPRRGFVSSRVLKRKAEAVGPIGNYAIIPDYWESVEGGWDTGVVERYALPRKIKESTFTRAAKIAGVDREAIRDFCRGGEDDADPTAAEQLAAEYLEYTTGRANAAWLKELGRIAADPVRRQEFVTGERV